MSTTPNPYQPPASIPPTGNRLHRLRRWIRGFPWTSASFFRRGGILIFDGIAFYVDPNDPSVAFAASPSATITTERMNLVVAEAIRVLPDFLKSHPSLHRVIRGRQLTVRLIETYTHSPDAVLREESLEWDVLNAFLDGDQSEDFRRSGAH